MTVFVRCDIDGTPGCCGVSQITDFSHPYDHEVNGDVNGHGKTEAAAYQNLFNNLMGKLTNLRNDGLGYNNFNQAVVQIWFVKRYNFEGKFDGQEFLAKPLMDLVEGIEGVICLGEHINPNSGNMIKGYQWEVK